MLLTTQINAVASHFPTAGKHNHQTKEAKAAVRICLQRGIAPRLIARAVVHELNRSNQSSEGEAERVKEFSYNTNKAIKKQKDQDATRTQKVASKTAKECVNSSPASTDLSDDQGKESGAPTNVEDLMTAGIPFQRNGVVYLQGDSLNKRKAAAMDQKPSSAKETKKQMSVESMTQERHWMAMWKDAKAELKKLREEIKDELDDEVKAELKSDIDSLRKKKDEWAVLLGMKD